MDLTMVLASIWGPILLAFGAGFFLSQKYYLTLYRNLEKEPFAVLFFGMFAMTAGIAQVIFHSDWSGFPAGLVSLLGWAILVKGIICTAVPAVAAQWGNRVLRANVVPAAGGFAALLGAYLSFIGYFA